MSRIIQHGYSRSTKMKFRVNVDPFLFNSAVKMNYMLCAKMLNPVLSIETVLISSIVNVILISE